MPCAGRFMCYVCMCIHAERARGRGPLVHMWNSGVNVLRCYIPKATSHIKNRSPMLRCSGFAESRQPLGPAWARGERATHQNGSGPPIRSGQPADPRSHDTLKLRSHAEVTLKTVKRTRAFSDSCSARATRGGRFAAHKLWGALP